MLTKGNIEYNYLQKIYIYIVICLIWIDVRQLSMTACLFLCVGFNLSFAKNQAFLPFFASIMSFVLLHKVNTACKSRKCTEKSF